MIWAMSRLLVVGGTSFVGRHAVYQAVDAGHDVTVFHRGHTNPDMLAGRIDHRLGDRTTGDYSSLDIDETWDAVLDVSAYVPRHVHQLADALAARSGHYVHVSSISAYDDTARITLDEDSPLWPDLTEHTEDVTGQTYGPLKAMCERAGHERFGEAMSIVRPTYVCGPHDATDRFTYWARRMAVGGDVAATSLDAPLQIVDARDLGAFLVTCAESAADGPFDGVGVFAPVREMLIAITPADVAVRLVEVDRATLDAVGVGLPLIEPEAELPELKTRPGRRAKAAGLAERSVAETADATRAWDAERGSPPLKVGPTAEQEADLLRRQLDV